MIASLGKYMRMWKSNSPASVISTMLKREGTLSEQKATEYVFRICLWVPESG